MYLVPRPIKGALAPCLIHFVKYPPLLHYTVRTLWKVSYITETDLEYYGKILTQRQNEL